MGKHSGPASTEVVLTGEGAALRIEVATTFVARRSSPGSNGNGNGSGINGMRERARLVGGDIDVGATEDGWSVRVLIPPAVGESLLDA